MADPPFTLAHTRIAILGLGLMGGSLALALRGQCAEVVGLDAHPDTEKKAVAAGMIDRSVDWPTALTFDLLILAAPVRAILASLASLRNLRPPINNPQSKIIIDLGSTKRAIAAAMEHLPVQFDPLGGHPMCGKEVSGLAHAEAALFQGKTFILTPLERTSSRALTTAHALIAAVGARPLVLPAEAHDRLAAYASHLPYLVAVALVNAAVAQGDARVWDIAASGFRDTSRLAGSDLTMMVDILLTNREAVLEALGDHQAQVAALKMALINEDAAQLRERLAAARRQRGGMFR